MGKPAVSAKRRMALALVGMAIIFLLLIARVVLDSNRTGK